MPRGVWSKKDERQYKAVLKSCLARDGRKTKKCKSMAAAVVNKRRGAEGRTTTSFRPASSNPELRRLLRSWNRAMAIAMTTNILNPLPKFNPKKFGLRSASKKECLYKTGPRKGAAKPGCVWGWGPKHRGKLFKAKVTRS